MEWDARPELIARLQASIAPVRTDAALREVLARHFPRDCSNLPISGGWGYSKADAIIFVRDRSAAPFVSLEYHIAQKIIYEELIISRPRNYGFSGISLDPKSQSLTHDNSRRYDRLKFLVSCWSDQHWEHLKQEWEINDFGRRPGFDQKAHAAKREAVQVRYDREFWFDVTEMFSGPGAR